jgi:PRC-barrel domain protein
MTDTLTFDRFSDLKGAEIRSADGGKLGYVNALLCDERTREPEWIGFGTGFLGLKEAVVPVKGARVAGKRIVVPYDEDVVKHEPAFDAEDGIMTADSEHRLCLYFSLTGHRPAPHQLTRYDFMNTDEP